MDLRLSRTADYTVRAALYLAGRWVYRGEQPYSKIREISAAMGLPKASTPHVVGLLARAGLAEAKAGRDGGYRLTRSPRQISLLEVVESADGPLTTDQCTLRGGPCHWEDVCALHPTWAAGAKALRAAIARTTLADLVKVDRGIAAGSFPIPSDAHRRRERAAGKKKGERATVGWSSR